MCRCIMQQGLVICLPTNFSRTGNDPTFLPHVAGAPSVTNATKSAESNPSLSSTRFITSMIAEISLGECRKWRSPIFQTAWLTPSCVDIRWHSNVQKSTVEGNIYFSTSEQLRYSKNKYYFQKLSRAAQWAPVGRSAPRAVCRSCMVQENATV